MTRLNPEWMARGACLKLPEDERQDFYLEADNQPDRDKQAARAVRVCARCPVREQCLRWALDHNETFHIWGGETPRQRHNRKMRHGSVEGYWEHRKARIAACDPCRAAWQTWKQAKEAA